MEVSNTAQIRTRKLQDDLENSAFDCGIDGVNDMVRRSYYPTLLQHLYAFEILADDQPVGYYMVGFQRLQLTDCPDDIGDYISDTSDYCYTLHIRYIAIAKKYQKLGIGTIVLKLLISSVFSLCVSWPIRLITLDALKEKVNWYKSLGFIAFNEKDICKENAKIRMYMDCLIDRNKLDQYHERAIDNVGF